MAYRRKSRSRRRSYTRARPARRTRSYGSRRTANRRGRTGRTLRIVVEQAAPQVSFMEQFLTKMKAAPAKQRRL